MAITDDAPSTSSVRLYRALPKIQAPPDTTVKMFANTKNFAAVSRQCRAARSRTAGSADSRSRSSACDAVLALSRYR
ncbi:hypothetical protein ASD28_08060 [Massilia sp. Root133]|nr:hypothetical protein ASD28_08060 [Massilia sp. Root133]KQZ48287.1 hypothetical protein ASD92_22470 [Massilia sp. Root1485]